MYNFMNLKHQVNATPPPNPYKNFRGTRQRELGNRHKGLLDQAESKQRESIENEKEANDDDRMVDILAFFQQVHMIVSEF